MDFKLIDKEEGKRQWESSRGDNIFYICEEYSDKTYIVDVFEGKEHVQSEFVDTFDEGVAFCKEYE